MSHLFLKVLVCALICTFVPISSVASASDKSRVIVTTDLGGTDPDDTQSMIHLLVCSDRIDIEGLVSSQVWITDSDKTSSILEVLDSYSKAYPNLKRHSDGFPTAEYLKSVTCRGQSVSNMDGVGDGKDSPGSDLIIKAVDKASDKRPVWIVAWGGMNTLAQTLHKVSITRNQRQVADFLSKIRIYDVLGQDDAGAYIAHEYPEILYIRNSQVYGWAPDDTWTRDNIQGKAPLGSCYPDRIWATEGDSPSFLYLLANGLNDPEHPDYGGWGGRFSLQKELNPSGMDFIKSSGKDESAFGDYYMLTSTREGVNAIVRWKQHIINDFAARIRWSATGEFTEANHHPLVAVNGDRSLLPLEIKAKKGRTLKLDARKTTDPDGDAITYRWYVYEEPGTLRGVEIENPDGPRCRVKLPEDLTGTVHIILEATDNGTPRLTSYKRVVVSVD